MPKQKTGYGPKQMMFTFASRGGDTYRLNGIWQKGMPIRSDLINPDHDEIMTTVVGWIHDGKQTHHDIVHQPAKVIIEKSGSVKAWEYGRNGEKFGGEILEKSDETLIANFIGKKGFAKFEVTSTQSRPTTKVHVSNLFNSFGSTDVVALRRFDFKGNFAVGDEIQYMEGKGYFQRVCTNFPMPSWFWTYVIFENGNYFGAFQPYIGLQLLKRTNKIYRAGIERAIRSYGGNAFYVDMESEKTYTFDKIIIRPIIEQTLEHPGFHTKVSSKNGDFIEMKLRSHGHTRFLLERPYFRNVVLSHFNYNEFMTKVMDIKGKINGQDLDLGKLGQGWGNQEYTWGISL